MRGRAGADGCRERLHGHARDPALRLRRQDERHGVRVETRDGLVYDFDYASFSADSLTGYRSRSDTDGPVDQTVALKLALDDIEHLTTRKVDWFRSGLIGGTVLAGVLVAGLNGNTKPAEPSPTSSGGGKGGIN